MKAHRSFLPRQETSAYRRHNPQRNWYRFWYVGAEGLYTYLRLPNGMSDRPVRALQATLALRIQIVTRLGAA